MKVARLLLLVLLTLVLPLRGALANVACCAEDWSEPSQAPTLMHGQGDKSHAEMPYAVHAAHGHAGASHAHEHDDTPSGSSAAHQCHACTASCSATPLLSTMPTVPAPMASADLVFPALSAPAPSHASERQERPPRSL